MAEELKVKVFKLDNTSFWVGYSHYQLREKGIFWCAGAEDTEEKREILRKYLKRKKMI